MFSRRGSFPVCQIAGILRQVHLETVVRRIVHSLDHPTKASITYANYARNMQVPFSGLSYLEHEIGGQFSACAMAELVEARVGKDV
jgi:hypothetical protein